MRRVFRGVQYSLVVVVMVMMMVMMSHRQSRLPLGTVGTLVRPSLRHRRRRPVAIIRIIGVVVVVLSSSRVCHVFGRARDPERDDQKRGVVHPGCRRRTEQRHAGGEIEDDGHASSSFFSSTEQPPTTPGRCFGARVVVVMVVVVVVLVLVSVIAAIIARRIILIVRGRHRGRAGVLRCVLTERGSTGTSKKATQHEPLILTP